MKKVNYKGYFRRHFNVSFSEKDILNYKKWFYSQWNFINSKIKIKPDDKILEIGSGFGGFYNFLKTKKNYVGLELDPDAVQFANKYFDTKNFKNRSIEELKTGENFDFVFAFEVLEHLQNPLDVIERISRLLKVKGVFCGTSPYPYYQNVVADSTHLFILHPENWRILFLRSGFRKVELYPMSFFPLLWRFKPRFNLRIPFYIPFPSIISTTLIIARK